MANNFDRLTASVDRIAEEVADVAEVLRNPQVDNNDQAVIDDLAGRLESAANALENATAADDEAPEGTGDVPVAEEEPVTDNGTPNEA